MTAQRQMEVILQAERDNASSMALYIILGKLGSKLPVEVEEVIRKDAEEYGKSAEKWRNKLKD